MSFRRVGWVVLGARRKLIRNSKQESWMYKVSHLPESHSPHTQVRNDKVFCDLIKSFYLERPPEFKIRNDMYYYFTLMIFRISIQQWGILLVYFSVSTVNLKSRGSKLRISSSIRSCPHFT